MNRHDRRAQARLGIPDIKADIARIVRSMPRSFAPGTGNCLLRISKGRSRTDWLSCRNRAFSDEGLRMEVIYIWLTIATITIAMLLAPAVWE
jgi:hypothetical protein